MKKITQLLSFAAVVGIAVPAAQAYHEFNYQFDVSLDGSQNVAGGDPDGSGMAELIVDAFDGYIWWDISVSDIAPVTIDHIHNAPAGSAGPIVVNFDGMLMGEKAIDTGLAQNIVENSEQYYVNLHNSVYPAVAVRGQLSSPTEVAKQVPDSMSASMALLAVSGLLVASRFRRRKDVA